MGRHLGVETDQTSERIELRPRRAVAGGSRRRALLGRLQGLFKVAPSQGSGPDGVDVAWRVKRGAVLCLLVGVLLWIGVSLWIRPLPQTQDLGTIKRTEPPVADGHATASPGTNSSSPSSSDSQPLTITVSIQGAVKKPGLYTVAGGERWGIILQQAGGILKGADLKSVNLAEAAEDGQQLYVPQVNEAPVVASPSGGAEASDGGAQSSVGATKPVTASVVNVNVATQEELQSLPGVGPALSKRIVDFRAQNGPFKSLEELDAVSGIGPALLKKFEGLVGF